MKVQNMISPKREINPTIYAYITPTNTEKVGWIKIGYTERDADTRIKEQTHTVGITAQKLWDYEARFNGGGYFTDHDFHSYLDKQGIKNEKGTEWYFFNDHPEKSKELYQSFVFKDYSEIQKTGEITYNLRAEQEDAVIKTLNYAKSNPNSEFLWNAKPRFGKTLSSYDLVRRLGAKHVLIVTNRPAIANSWYDDFEKFIAWQTDYKFVSESDSLKSRPTLTRDEFTDHITSDPDASQIAFLSLQDLKGSKYFGGEYDKLQWVSTIDWDILIIDEAHEGIDTFLTETAFDNIKRDFTLHLSGTPFKAIAKGNFSKEQIFNWSYADEQEVKENWDSENTNPYAELPKLNMFTYQMSQMITDKVSEGTKIGERELDFAFDLNEFFATKENGSFEHEEDVAKWLDTLSSNEKYPFSTKELRNELKHTFWVLHRVASVKALEKLLRNHPVFEDYKVVIAAGDGQSEDDEVASNDSSLLKVQDAIANNDKTITLSVGQLTTGVTIPEWTAVLMLSDMKSPAMYMQSAFRSQNPHNWTETVDGKEIRYQKQNSYVFDFAPQRTLTIFDEFANNLLTKTSSGGGTTEDREENIKRLLNFFPVIGEDTDGEMVELDATEILTIPQAIKASEVVSRGFMSNLLFANISGIFQAPQVALDILSRLNKESQGRLRTPDSNVDLEDIKVDDDGNAIVDDEIIKGSTESIFGNKIYDIKEVLPNIDVKQGEGVAVEAVAKDISSKVVKDMEANLSDIKETYGLTNNGVKTIENKVASEIEHTVKKAATDFNIQKAHVEKQYETKLKSAESDYEKGEIELEWKAAVQDAVDTFQHHLEEEVSKSIETVKKEIVKEQEVRQETRKKTAVEEDVRSRLRGFARTIPSFIMAYGDIDLTLEQFDKYVPNEVFSEVTGITIDQFVFLRDGGEYEEDGEQHYFEGKLFDENVFNQSVQEFLKKKSELGNYFIDRKEDIFDYIPPQETNQIYTPKNVVKMMVETLEKENPGIFDDSSKTFIDIYMKSGLYITEIVKRLYNSEVIKNKLPNDEERIKHILENQVFGFAPSEIIYRIAINFIFGNLDSNISRKNFLHIDTTPYAQSGKIQELVNKKFK